MTADRKEENPDGRFCGELSVWVVLTSVVGILAVVWVVLKLGDEAQVRVPDEARLADFALVPQSGVWLGIDLQAPGDAARKDGSLPAGVVISRVMQGSPADKAGLRAGDVVERVQGNRVHQPVDLMRIVSGKKAGDTIRMTIDRLGTRRPLRVTLGTWPMGTLAAAAADASWLGIDVQPIDDLLARRLGLPDRRGVIVSYVYPGSPALDVGFVQGDVIRRIGETRVRDIHQVSDLVSTRRPGDTLRLNVFHRGAQKEIRVKLKRRPPGKRRSAVSLPEAEVEIEAAWLGLDIVPLSRAEAEELGLPAGLHGMVVDDVAPGRGVDAGFQAGDVIVAVNGRSTRTVTDFKEATEQAVGAVVDVVRYGHHIYLSVPPPGAVGPAGKQNPPVQAM